MTIHDWPDDLAPTEMSMDLMTPASVYTDQRTGRRLRLRRANDLWIASMSFRNLCRTDWKKLVGFLAKLEGPIGSVRLYDFSDPVPEGSAGAGYFGSGPFEEEEIEVGAGAAVGATTITVRLNTAISGPPLLAGDCFSLPNDRRHVVIADMASGGSVGATLSVNFMPPLAEAISDNDPIEIYFATDIFNLVSKPPLPRGIERLVSVDLQFVQETRP